MKTKFVFVAVLLAILLAGCSSPSSVEAIDEPENWSSIKPSIEENRDALVYAACKDKVSNLEDYAQYSEWGYGYSDGSHTVIKTTLVGQVMVGSYLVSFQDNGEEPFVMNQYVMLQDGQEKDTVIAEAMRRLDYVTVIKVYYYNVTVDKDGYVVANNPKCND